MMKIYVNMMGRALGSCAIESDLDSGFLSTNAALELSDMGMFSDALKAVEIEEYGSDMTKNILKALSGNDIKCALEIAQVNSLKGWLDIPAILLDDYVDTIELPKLYPVPRHWDLKVVDYACEVWLVTKTGFFPVAQKTTEKFLRLLE